MRSTNRRPTILPTRPPRTLGRPPRIVPITVPNVVAMMASSIDSRVATSTLTKTSRPSASVPSQCLAELPCCIAETSIEAVRPCSTIGARIANAASSPLSNSAVTPSGVRSALSLPPPFCRISSPASLIGDRRLQ